MSAAVHCPRSGWVKHPTLLNRYGIGIESVRAAIATTNATRPKGMVEDG